MVGGGECQEVLKYLSIIREITGVVCPRKPDNSPESSLWYKPLRFRNGVAFCDAIAIASGRAYYHIKFLIFITETGAKIRHSMKMEI